MPTFIDDCLAGVAHPDDIDRYIEQWHEAETPLPLSAYLGMTQEAYADWVRTPNALTHLLAGCSPLVDPNTDPTAYAPPVG